jgi:hypothetical protein
MFRALKQFKQREGHLRVPKRQVEDGLKLGGWVCFHRVKQNAGTLVSEKERTMHVSPTNLKLNSQFQGERHFHWEQRSQRKRCRNRLH